MDRTASMQSAVVLLLTSLGSVFCTNFPPVSNPIPIPIPPQENAPLDLKNDAIFRAIISTDFKPAERIPDSFTGTEPTTEKPSSDLVFNEVNSPKAETGQDDWVPPSGTAGPVATPRPDAVDSGAPFQAEGENAMFSLPPVQDNARKLQRPSIFIISRGITGQYSEQQLIPIDFPIPRGPPQSANLRPGGPLNQNVPGIFPVFPSSIRPDLVLLSGGKPQPTGQVWISQSVSSDVRPLPLPKYSPPIMRTPPRTVVLIQNGSYPFAVLPPPTMINAPPPIEIKPLFPPFPYTPKKITFPAPNTFVFQDPPETEAPVTNPPVEETSTTGTKVSTTPPPTTAPVTLPPLKSSPPPPPPSFVLQPKDQTFQAFPPVFPPLIPTKFSPSDIMSTVFSPKTNADYFIPKLLPKSSLQLLSKTSASPTIPNPWIPIPNSLLQQFLQQNMGYPLPLSFSRQKPQGDSSSDQPYKPLASDVVGNPGIPPPSSDLWIIRGSSNPQQVSKSQLPVAFPSDPMPSIAVPIRGEGLPPVLYQGMIPTFPSIPSSFPIYPTGVNSSNKVFPNPFRVSKNAQPSAPQLGFYFPSSNRPSYSGFPISYPVVPIFPQLSQKILLPPASNRHNCSSPTNQNPNIISQPPPSFYVEPSVPIYLPSTQTSYNLVPNRPSIKDAPAAVYQPIQAAVSNAEAPKIPETPLAQETENTKQNEPQLVVISRKLPPAPEVFAADNEAVAPIFPFFNPPVVFPKPTAVNEADKGRTPYYFGYDQRDLQGALQHRREEADSDGTVKGSYGYRDANGIYRKVDYTADKGGYRAVVGTSDPGDLFQQSTDSVDTVNENSFAASTLENGTLETET